jgi:uncharacterized protein (TIGR03118 family)
MSWIRLARREWARRHRSPCFLPVFELLEDRSLPSGGFSQSNLISDIPGLASITDPKLVNPWGISVTPNNPFWFADARTGISSVYDDAKGTEPLAVTIRSSVSEPSTPPSPTGTVFNGTEGFAVSEHGQSGPSLFLFATLQGTIAGWNPDVDLGHAIVAVDNGGTPGVGPVYTGLTLASSFQGTFLYAANFRAGTIDVFDPDFKPVHMNGGFADPNLPPGFAPFNVQEIDGSLFVTYTRENSGRYDQGTAAGDGYIDVFDASGVLTQRLVSGGPLDAPWGVTLSPDSFGAFSHDLLVGNFADGHINAFDPASGAFLGTLSDTAGEPVVIPNLWALSVVNNSSKADPDGLYVTAGIGNEHHGLVAELQPAAAGADSQEAALNSVLQNLPSTGDDYPLPPSDGPALRSTESAEALSPVLVGLRGAPLGMVPTLLANRAGAGTAVFSSPETTVASPAGNRSALVIVAMMELSGIHADRIGVPDVDPVRADSVPLWKTPVSAKPAPHPGVRDSASPDSSSAGDYTVSTESDYSLERKEGTGSQAGNEEESLPLHAQAVASQEKRQITGGSAWLGAVLLGCLIPVIWAQRQLHGGSPIALWSRLTRRITKTVLLSQERSPVSRPTPAQGR